MADAREDATVKMEGLQRVRCWVPAAMTESNLTNQQPICRNWQEQGIDETNRSEIGEFLPGTQCQTAPASCSSKDFVHVTGGSGNRQAVEADNSGIVLDSSLNGLSFGNLLALIHNQGKIGDGHEHTGSVARSSSSAVCFHPVDEGTQLTEEFGNSPLQDQESGLEANRDAEPNVPKVFTDGGSILSKPCFDLNMPLWAITDAASCKNKSSQFEPETPLKNNKDEYRVPHRQYLSMEDEQHEMKESSVTSRQLQKYHKLRNGDEDQVDLIETHQQKPRRKKHGGGKQKCTPKRNYVRKNRIQIPEDEGSCIPPTNTRFLSFNLDAQEMGQSSLNCLSSSCNRVSQAENLNAEDPSKRTVQCGLEIVLMIDQKDAGIPHDQENMLAEKINAESNLPNVFTDGSSIPSEPYFDLNLPPKTITNAALDKSKPSQFEPETPEKNTRNENWVPSRQHLNTEDVLAGKGRQEKKVTRNGLMELHERKEMSQQVLDQSVVFSGQLQENNKPDNRGKDQVDSIKTHQQNPSRKKHMPRVSIEGKQNATPESSEENFNLQQKTTGVKRKYARGREKEYQPVDEVYLVSTPQNKPRRKKHRPRVIKEGKQKGTPKKTTVKRKYARRNGTYEPEDGGPYMLRTRNSCRRFLNFNLDDQEKEQSSLYCLSSNCNRGSEAENLNTIDSSKRTVQCGQEIVLMMGKPDMGIAHESMHSINQVQEVFMERPGQSPSSSINMHLLENNSLVDEHLSTRGKCQIVFSDVTHDKEIKSSSMSTNHTEQRTRKNLIDLICHSEYLAPERQNWKTQNIAITAQAENSNRNETATFGNSLENCLTLFSQIADGNSSSGLYFPAICKKRRSKRRRNMVTATMQCIASSTGNHAKLGQCITRYSSTTQCASMARATDHDKEQNQVLEDVLVLRPKERIKKKRSKGRKRLRDLSSLLEIHKMLPAFRGRAPTLRNGHGRRILREPRFVETPALGTWRTTIRKKRSKRDLHINSTVLQYNQQKSSVIFKGLPLALTWKGSLSVDLITKQLNQLDLNAESTQELSQYPNALVKYHTRHEQHALVPFQKYGAVVPFDSSFDQDRRVWPRPKVDIDNETTRVWKLLLENINSEGIDGTDEENTTRWREERRVYSGRAESFVARMRLVQGDRRFTPWKGSVVDSVVGVFLTQNVSDHLSSSAFISLAARFPANTQIHPSDLQEEKLGIIIEESEVYDIDPEGIFRLNKEILNQPVYSGQDTENIIQELSSVRSSGNSSSGFVSKDNLTEQSTESSKHNLVQSLETVAIKTASFIEDGRDREDAYSSAKSADSPTAQTTEKSDSCVLSSTTEEQTAWPESNRFTSSTSFVKLLQMAGTILVRDPNEKLSDQDWQGQSESESLATNLYTGDHLNNATFSSEPFTLRSESILRHAQCNLSHEASKCFKSSSKKEPHADEISELSSESALQARIEKIVHSSLEGSKFCSPNAESSNNDQAEINQTGQVLAYDLLEENNSGMQMFKVATSPQHTAEIRSSNSKIDNSENSEHKDVNSNINDPDYHHSHIINGQNAKKRGRTSIKKEKQVKWDNLRKQAHAGDRERVRTANTADSVDWDAVRCADVNEIAKTIKERGMNNMLAQRIKDFLNRLVRDHGSIDLEWLRDVPPDKAKEYLLSINGLGLKSVECVRLLTLHHVAFPVDTNVGRIAVRLGWVPLQPLPESLQLHLLELYPVLESIQKYLWPRLCKLDQGTLYELHYQLITFGKVFCSKSKPNCNACPMRGECKHFASAFASARLALPAPEEKGIMCTNEKRILDHNPMTSTSTLQLPLLQANQMDAKSGAVQPIIEEPPSPEPIIELPTTPESLYISDPTIEDAFSEEPDEIPTIQLNMEELTHNLQEIMQQNKELVEGDVSKALVALTSEAASIPVPKLKNMSRLRTEHQVYELPDSHPLLEGMDKREPDDPSSYLLAIWTPGETMDSIQPPERWCSCQGLEKLCTNETCPSCNSIREADSQTVRGTLLIPCRTAMRGSFPLNGTYFQVNEVFSDHESSLSPFIVPRSWLWNLPRRTVFFGTSIPTIFKGLSTEGIQYCFWRGFVCVRGFDRKIRAPRPLVARLHFPASKLGRRKGI